MHAAAKLASTPPPPLNYKKQLEPRVRQKLISVCPTFTHRLIASSSSTWSVSLGQDICRKLPLDSRWGGGVKSKQGWNYVIKSSVNTSPSPVPQGIRALESKIITFLHSPSLWQPFSFGLFHPHPRRPFFVHSHVHLYRQAYIVWNSVFNWYRKMFKLFFSSTFGMSGVDGEGPKMGAFDEIFWQVSVDSTFFFSFQFLQGEKINHEPKSHVYEWESGDHYYFEWERN